MNRGSPFDHIFVSSIFNLADRDRGKKYFNEMGQWKSKMKKLLPSHPLDRRSLPGISDCLLNR